MGRKKADKPGGGQTRKRGTKAAAPPTATVDPANDDAKRELFLHHRQAWIGWQAKVKALDKIGDDVKAALKADGFLIAEFKCADQLADQRGEIKVKSEVSMRLRVARWIGHPMGAQLDLFAKADTAAKRNPYDEGKQCSMENRPGKPPSEWGPDSVEYRDFMQGYHDHQETLVPGAQHQEGNGGQPRKEWHRGLQEQHAAVEEDIKRRSAAATQAIGDQPATFQHQ